MREAAVEKGQGVTTVARPKVVRLEPDRSMLFGAQKAVQVLGEGYSGGRPYYCEP